MRILILSTHYYPDVAATGIIIKYLSEDLAQNGNSVTVITSVPHYDSRNELLSTYVPPRTERLKDGKLIVHRVPVFVPSRKSWILGRALNFFSFMMLSAACALRVGKQDVLLVVSPPLSNGLTADLISRLKRIPFVLNVQDIWPDAVVRAGAIHNAFVIAASNRLEKYIYGRARQIVVVSRNMRKSLLQKNTKNAVAVIENFCDTNFVKPYPRHNQFSRQHSLDDSFVVLFAGNIGYSQGLETLVTTAELLRDISHIVFLIVGNGVMKTNIVSEVQRRALWNVRFLPFQPHENVPLMYASCDVGLVLLRKGFANTSEPSKLLSIMSAGRPVIAAVDRESETWRLIEETRCGVCVEPEDSVSLADCIRDLAMNADLRPVLGSNGRRAAVDGYCRSRGLHKYEMMLNSVTSN
jgi:putative colanic acid biosynthesis glycosyltransferase WcaI